MSDHWLRPILLVALGGAAGAVARYGTGLLAARYWRGAFPLGTLSVNLLGCLLIGVLLALLGRNAVGEGTRMLAAVGFLGAYTTFSTFSYETLALIQQGRFGTALLYVALSVVPGLLLVWLGLWLGAR